MSIWTLEYEGYDPETERHREALCTLGNGYFATRGAAPESAASDHHYPGTYVAGLYNRLVTTIAGRDIVNEDLVNCPNWLVLRYRREHGDWFDLDTDDLEDYRQVLDIRRGVLSRSFIHVDDEGRRTRVTQRRLVHMRDPHLAGIQTTFLAENWSGRLTVRSGIDGTVTNAGVARYRNLNSNHLDVIDSGFTDDGIAHVWVRTTQSRIGIAVAARTDVLDDGHTLDVDRDRHGDDGFVAEDLHIDLEEGAPRSVDKVVSLFTSRDRAVSEPGRAARAWIRREGRFDDLLESHVLAWDHLWDRFHLATGASMDEATALNLHQFHLLQTVSKHTIDLDVGVPARGWHGEAYRGHIFWDELFIFPYLNLHLPDLTKALLMYRYRRLPEARHAASQAGLEGALYPWQSGSSGREESQVVHLNPNSGNWVPDNSSLQRHVNLAIAYNVWQYYQATNDAEFLAYAGGEMLIGIARLFASLSTYNRALDRYEILGVMGPDEFHDGYPDRDEPGLDNNAYTNVMAAWMLCRAGKAIEFIPEFRRSELIEKLHVMPEEMERWEDISRKLVVEFHDGVISQFAGYGDLEELDWDAYREQYGDIHRLDRILEAEGDTPNRYKLSKQADVLMLFYLLSGPELREIFGRLGYEIDVDMIRRTIDYYDERTSHGSTLSRLVTSWVRARWDRGESWEDFRGALFSDIVDIQGGTTEEGIHLGAMAGTVDLVQRGYPGIQTREHTLWLDPVIPDELRYLSFEIRYRGHLVEFLIERDTITVATRRTEAQPIRVGIRDQVVEVQPGTTRTVDLH